MVIILGENGLIKTIDSVNRIEKKNKNVIGMWKNGTWFLSSLPYGQPGIEVHFVFLTLWSKFCNIYIEIWKEFYIRSKCPKIKEDNEIIIILKSSIE